MTPPEFLRRQPPQEVTISPTVFDEARYRVSEAGNLTRKLFDDMLSDEDHGLKKPDGTPLSQLELDAIFEGLQAEEVIGYQPDSDDVFQLVHPHRRPTSRVVTTATYTPPPTFSTPGRPVRFVRDRAAEAFDTTKRYGRIVRTGSKIALRADSKIMGASTITRHVRSIASAPAQARHEREKEQWEANRATCIKLEYSQAEIETGRRQHTAIPFGTSASERLQQRMRRDSSVEWPLDPDGKPLDIGDEDRWASFMTDPLYADLFTEAALHDLHRAIMNKAQPKLRELLQAYKRIDPSARSLRDLPPEYNEYKSQIFAPIDFELTRQRIEQTGHVPATADELDEIIYAVTSARLRNERTLEFREKQRKQQGEPKTAQDRYEEQMAKYNEKVRKAIAYIDHPDYGDLFERDRLVDLHVKIQEVAKPDYDAELAAINARIDAANRLLPPDAQEPRVSKPEDIPYQRRQEIIVPIDRRITEEVAGTDNPAILESLTLARLIAVGKLRKPTPPTATRQTPGGSKKGSPSRGTSGRSSSTSL